MAKRNRLFLTGSERAEYEHIYGALPVDDTDTRFVLVTDEEASRIRALPAGVPVRAQSQDAESRNEISKHFAKAAELAGQDFAAGTEPWEDVETADGAGAGGDGSGTASPAEPKEPVGTSKAPKS